MLETNHRACGAQANAGNTTTERKNIDPPNPNTHSVQDIMCKIPVAATGRHTVTTLGRFRFATHLIIVALLAVDDSTDNQASQARPCLVYQASQSTKHHLAPTAAMPRALARLPRPLWLNLS
jgi:hypothetical protein